jgi:hypothetical protein
LSLKFINRFTKLEFNGVEVFMEYGIDINVIHDLQKRGHVVRYVCCNDNNYSLHYISVEREIEEITKKEKSSNKNAGF